MSTLRRVAIVGLGMIGGSVARGLARRGVDVLGHDANDEHVDAAIAEGVVSRRLSDDLSDVGSAEAVVIAVDGDSALDVLEVIQAHGDALELIMDVGSTKRTIVARAERLGLAKRFIGAHPFAGDHRSGWFASRADLFMGETAYLCPTPRSEAQAFAAAEAIWISLGAVPVRMDAAEHDALLAWTSHLPHLVSVAVALALAGEGTQRSELGRGGRDVTRLAAGSPGVWTAIALDNGHEIEMALEAVEAQLRALRLSIRERDRECVSAQLSKAREWASGM